MVEKRSANAVPLPLWYRFCDARRSFETRNLMTITPTDHRPHSDLPCRLETMTDSTVLSEKVSRALQVRTDTPAMKAALEALSHLNSGDLDSRSVRVAIEQDALQQAKFLKHELQALCDQLSSLREGVADSSSFAQTVQQAIHTNVITDETPTTMIQTGTTGIEDSKQGNDGSRNALEEEAKLAAVLSEAFVNRNIARKRLVAVNDFLEKFDLSEEDSR
jgi:hypothetical protein